MPGQLAGQSRFKYWIPAILAAILISIFSTKGFEETHTARYILPALHWLFPAASQRLLHRLHTGIRKMAHIAEFGVFSILIFRAWRSGRQGWRLEWAIATLLIAVGYASLDEIHQIFVPGRGPSVRDVAIDTVGALLAQLLAWWYETRKWLLAERPQDESGCSRPSL